MSRFLKPDKLSSDEEEDPRVVPAKPISSKYARMLGHYGAGKDFIVGSSKSQQEFYVVKVFLIIFVVISWNNIVEKNNLNTGETIDEKATLELRNKLGAKILKAKLQKKTDLVEKLEKELHALENKVNSSPGYRILYRTDRGDAQIPLTLRTAEKKDSKISGRIDAIHHADIGIRDMVAEEKTAVSDDRVFNSALTAAKHRTNEDWILDDAMMSVKRSRKAEEKEERRIRNDIIQRRFFVSNVLLLIIHQSLRLAAHTYIANGCTQYILFVSFFQLYYLKHFYFQLI
ncbi:unnamed protein product [Thelazia callipaeda]|uniref:RED_N domain-containing protein n=1 Tax=Thelazia callipaeda TaxID=103827 RepID=A0A0N5D942_THECL|nr:unnamed protein product [Thelazia callipaeda]